MSDNKHRCSAMFMDGYHRVQCPRNASVECNGKYYCKTHDPVRILERREKSDAEYQRKISIQREYTRRLNAASLIFAEVATDDLEKSINVYKSAPDMLEALEAMLNVFNRGLPDGSIGQGTCRNAEAVIAAARGES